MVRSSHLAGRFSGPRTWRRRLMLLLVIGALLLVGGYTYLTRPQRVGRLAGELLRTLTDANVSIDDARFSLDGNIQLRDVVIRVPGMAPDAGRIFDAEQVLIKHDLGSLLRGRFNARSLTFLRPTLYRTEDLATGRFNYEMLREQKESAGPKDLPTRLPEVFIRQGRVQLGEVEDSRYVALGQFHISGHLTGDAANPGAYYFVLRQDLPEGDAGPTASGQLDLNQLRVQAKIEHFALDAPQRSVLPRWLRDYWDQLEPTGSMPTMSFGYDPDPAIGVHAVLELQNAGITLPFGEMRTRMTGVSGRFTLARETVSIDRLRGKIEDLSYEINGRAHGLGMDSPFELHVQVAPFVIPDEPRYLLALPAAVQKQFQRFSPSGTLQARVTIKRVEPGDELRYDGQIDLVDARGTYGKFPYPVQDLRGRVRFNNEEIRLVWLRGRGPTGARVVLSGRIAPPTDKPEISLSIDAYEVPIDGLIYEALREEQRALIQQFLHQPGYDRLVDRGLVQTAAQQAQRRDALQALRAQGEADAVRSDALAVLERRLSAPLFELGGRVKHVHVDFHRPAGPDAQPTINATVDIGGINALYQQWPYPLTISKGRLLIKPGQVVLENIAAQGLHGGGGKVSGTIDLPTRDHPRPLRPDIRFAAQDMPADALLLASLPKHSAPWLADLHVTGVGDATGSVFRSEEGVIDFRVDAELREGSARPFTGGYPLSDATGKLSVGRRGATIHSFRARHGESELSASGRLAWGRGLSVDLKFAAQGVNLEHPVLDLLPPDEQELQEVRRWFEAHRPAGVFDGELTWRRTSGKADDYRLDLRPRTLALDLNQQRIELHEISGGMVVTRDGLQLDNWRARFPGGALGLSGQIGLGAGPQVNVLLDLSGDRVGPVPRALLPAGVLSIIEGVKLSGPYEVQQARVVYRPGLTQGQDLLFRGTVRFRGASAELGVNITNLDADLALDVQREAGATWPLVDMRLQASSLRAAERRIAPLTVHIASNQTLDVLEIRHVHGTVYGGQLLGQGQIQLGGEGAYRIAVTVQDAALEPLVEPNKDHAWVQPNGDARQQATLSANLAVEGLPGDTASRRGRGEMEIRDASLYEMPISLALLQVVNLSLPTSRSFERASADYLLEGDLVRLEGLRFMAPNVEVAGSGLLRLDTRAMDLKLVTRNPSSLKLGPVSELLRVVKNELVSIHVTGTLDQPRTRVQSFTGVRDSWRDIFNGPRRPEPTARVNGAATTAPAAADLHAVPPLP